MKQADLIQYRLLSADRRTATLEFRALPLRDPARVQILRIDTGAGTPAYSVYATCQAGSKVFEASAKLTVSAPDAPVESILHGLMADKAFLGSILRRLIREVDRHLATKGR